MTTKLLPIEDWELLEPIFRAYGTMLPDPRLAQIAVSEDDDGQIVGFLVCQLIPHLEPIWVHPEYRGGSVCIPDLVKTVTENLRPGTGLYAFAPSQAIGALCESVGMQPLPWRTYLMTTSLADPVSAEPAASAEPPSAEHSVCL